MKKILHLFVFLSMYVTCSSGYEGFCYFLNFLNLTTPLIKNTETDKAPQEIFISGEPGTSVIVYNFKSVTKEVKTFTNNQSFYIRIDYELGGNNLSTYYTPIVISSLGGPISIQCNKATRDSGAGYLALPLSEFSTEYYLASYSLTENIASTFTISAVTGGTCLNLVKFGKNGTQQVMNHFSLDAGETFQGEIDDDITGVYVSSSKPIAVFSGHKCIKIPVGRLYCDHIYEQMVPVKEWGTIHFVSSLKGISWSSGYILRIIVALSQNITLKIISYSSSYTVQTETSDITEVEGHTFLERFINGNPQGPTVTVIDCPKTCFIMQYCTGSVNDSNSQQYSTQPDPFMMTVPSIEHYPRDVHFSTSHIFLNLDNVNFDLQEPASFVTIILKKAFVPLVSFDGLPLTSAGTDTISIDFQYNSETYTVISFQITYGFHSVTSGRADIYFAVFVYGYGLLSNTGGKPTAYGYLGGYRYTYGGDGSLVQTGPWFDPLSPIVKSPSTDPPSPSSPRHPVVTLSDLPYEVTIWNTSFCTIHPMDNIIRKKCSEGYSHFFLKERISYMETKLQDTCINATINLTLLPMQYSEYTCGHIFVLIKVTGINEASLQTISDCTDSINTIVTPLPNWMQDGTYRIDRVIDPTTDDSIGDCAPVHFKSNEMFVMRSRGWTCP